MDRESPTSKVFRPLISESPTVALYPGNHGRLKSTSAHGGEEDKQVS